MSYNPNFYNNFPSNTFQRFFPSNIPPPPLPPPFYVPTPPVKVTDQVIIKKFENQIKPVNGKCKIKSESISEVKEKLRIILEKLNDVKERERILQENMQSLSNDKWDLKMEEMQIIKDEISNSLALINGNYLEVIKKLIAKRSAKRMRLKRLRVEKKREKEERIKKLEERSRKIDENLQKIKDDTEKAKHEEQSKLQADIVLREVLRKKLDTKKCITKLEMLVKLRRARENTARGRGETVTEREGEEFNSKIEKLKQVWLKRQAIYIKEENQLRAELQSDSDKQELANESERQVERTLGKWRRVMFGSSRGSPQVEFADVGKFVNVRSHWDQYINADGSSIPIGWVTPTPTLWSID